MRITQEYSHTAQEYSHIAQEYSHKDSHAEFISGSRC